jgi:hypothetical protein
MSNYRRESYNRKDSYSRGGGGGGSDYQRGGDDRIYEDEYGYSDQVGKGKVSKVITRIRLLID